MHFARALGELGFFAKKPLGSEEKSEARGGEPRRAKVSRGKKEQSKVNQGENGEPGGQKGEPRCKGQHFWIGE